MSDATTPTPSEARQVAHEHTDADAKLFALSLEIDSKNCREVTDADLVRWALSIQHGAAAIRALRQGGEAA